MNTQLSLESIKTCLLMEKKAEKCTEILLDVNLESFLESEEAKQKDIIDSIFQKLKEEKKAAEEFNQKITDKKAEYEVAQNAVKVAGMKLAEIASKIVLQQQKYNIAESNVQQAAQAHGAQIKTINDLQNKIDTTVRQLKSLSSCECDDYAWETLIRIWKQQQNSLKQAKNDLNNKVSDKTTKEQAKIQASIELQNSLNSKTQVESDLKKSNENQNIVKAAIEAMELEKNQINLDTLENKWNEANEAAMAIQDMLKQLTNVAEEVKEMSHTYEESEIGKIFVEESHVEQ